MNQHMVEKAIMTMTIEQGDKKVHYEFEAIDICLQTINEDMSIYSMRGGGIRMVAMNPTPIMNLAATVLSGSIQIIDKATNQVTSQHRLLEVL
jgi:hypothetical protein